MTYQYPQQQPYAQPLRPMPSKKKTPMWVWVAAVISGLFILGVIGSALSDGDKKTAATITVPVPITTSVHVLTGPPTTSAAAQVKDLVVPDDLVGNNGAVAADELKRLGFTNVTYGSATPGVNAVLLPSNTIELRAGIGAVMGFFAGLPIFIVGSIPAAFAGAGTGALSPVIAKWSANQMPGPY
ncbi:hypothetical protein [Nocardia sp. NPDC004711]